MIKRTLVGTASLVLLLFWGCSDEEYTVQTGANEQAAQRQAVRPLVAENEEVEVPGTGVSIKLVLVKAGSFVMGDGSQNAPRHNVRLTHDFYMATTEVTQGMYKAVYDTSDTPSHFNYSDEHPLEHISHGEALRFCERLSVLTGYHFELPTEAQWEYAAYGGAGASATAYAGGGLLNVLGWYRGNSDTVGYVATSEATGRDTMLYIRRTSEVARKAPNALGIYDMSGNVREWCADSWSELGSEAATDPVCTTRTVDKVVRGGACNDSAQYCRVAWREAIPSGSRGFSIGFRVVVNVD
ncbi:MAG: formylglycine-generating enzyme family protein [Bacteroidales bacterium]|nr:formylglycine-generating enzyme family protein [Bacteroidales bacterium]